jgi:hypothetical protein
VSTDSDPAAATGEVVRVDGRRRRRVAGSVSRRALPGLAVVVAGLGALVAVGRIDPVESAPVFATTGDSWMPAVSDTEVLTRTWFCPGVPASGEDGIGGDVVVANRDENRLSGRFSIFGPDGEITSQELTVEPWSRSTIEVDAFARTAFASVAVEIEGGSGIVEQVARHPAGEAVTPCATDTSTEWYLADGFTVDGSTETLILTNPHDEPVIAELVFSTREGERSPDAFKGFPIAPRSVRTIPIAELGARNEPRIAVSITARTGRLVVGRAQHYVGGGRSGYSLTLAAPALTSQQWFADGESGPGVSEQIAIYNPTDDDVEITLLYLGLPVDADFGGNLDPIEVPAGEVVVVDTEQQTAESAQFPDGRHAVLVATTGFERVIVAERILTRPAGQSVATSVLMGAPPRIDGYVATRWHIPQGPGEPVEDALVVYNVDSVEGTVTVSAVGPAGPSPVPSLTDLPIGPGAVVTVDLTDPNVLDQELIVTATNRVFVERSWPRGEGRDGRTAAWALPADPE